MRKDHFKRKLLLWTQVPFKWTNHCVLSGNGNDNTDANPNNIFFLIKDTKLHVSAVTLSVKDNQILSKFFSKEFERSVYWNEYIAKSENKHMANEYRYFLESNFVGVNRLSVYLNQDDNDKWYKSRKHYLPKSIIKNYNVIINGKNFYDQPIDSEIKYYKEI